MLKLKPFEKYVGDDPVKLYVGIRADEPHRKGYVSTKTNITACFPFVDDGLTHRDIMDLLERSGLGLPDYYKWRSRSGCYFCFYQQRREWVGLLENHEDLYWKAAEFEKYDPETGEGFTWIEGESLTTLANDPERIAAIKKEYEERMLRKSDEPSSSENLADVFGEDDGESCPICHL